MKPIVLPALPTLNTGSVFQMNLSKEFSPNLSIYVVFPTQFFGADRMRRGCFTGVTFEEGELFYRLVIFFETFGRGGKLASRAWLAPRRKRAQRVNKTRFWNVVLKWVQIGGLRAGTSVGPRPKFERKTTMRIKGGAIDRPRSGDGRRREAPHTGRTSIGLAIAETESEQADAGQSTAVDPRVFGILFI